MSAAPKPFPITVAHSPDADDAFMFYALTHGKIDPRGLSVSHELADIETLNQRAREGRYEVTALSVHAYPHVADRYAILSSGASVGDGYGPIVVSRQPMEPAALSKITVAVPGQLTTAFLALSLLHPPAKTLVMPFDAILPAVQSGKVDAGLIIHEGQLTYGQHGLHRVTDLGADWKALTGLPLPLGVNAIRLDLPEDVSRRFQQAFREAVDWARAHRQEALGYALKYGRGIAAGEADRFVSMYVNDFTSDLGEVGRKAIGELLGRARTAGLLERDVPIRFA